MWGCGRKRETLRRYPHNFIPPPPSLGNTSEGRNKLEVSASIQPHPLAFDRHPLLQLGLGMSSAYPMNGEEGGRLPAPHFKAG